MGTIYESKFYDFVFDQSSNALIFRWKPETETIDDLSFRESLSNYAGFVLEMGVPHAIVDLREFQPPAGVPMPETGGAWRTEVAVPRYNKVIKKFAYLAGPGADVSTPSAHPPERYETGVFNSEDQLKAWLAG